MSPAARYLKSVISVGDRRVVGVSLSGVLASHSKIGFWLLSKGQSEFAVVGWS